MNREELLHKLEANFQGLLSAIDGLGEEAMLRVWYGEWSVRDILAHIAGWHRELGQALERMARGERPFREWLDYNDDDVWNKIFAAARRNTPPQEMIQELKASKEAFVTAVRQLPEDRLQDGRAAYRLLHYAGIDHYPGHAGDIRAWRQKEEV
ncbi:MAG TPA: ClbS/DfsB family four-helix bundle protein [Dehalococcoidia bacterium]|nr:ClbS/DfsB family four-helix bundle protein [Dehalococcoidia bacterium]